MGLAHARQSAKRRHQDGQRQDTMQRDSAPRPRLAIRECGEPAAEIGPHAGGEQGDGSIARYGARGARLAGREPRRRPGCQTPQGVQAGKDEQRFQEPDSELVPPRSHVTGSNGTCPFCARVVQYMLMDSGMGICPVLPLPGSLAACSQFGWLSGCVQGLRLEGSGV